MNTIAAATHQLLMKLAMAFVCSLICQLAAAAEWTPPETPDPQKVLNEARSDALARNYETALAKHVWFHENSLKFQRSLSGVRLSFALASWRRLGESYPPALEKLKEIRDETRQRVAPKEGRKIAFEDFHDLASINEELDDDADTVEAFKLLDAKGADAAERVFNVAEPALIDGKEYALCGKYIESDESLRRIVDNYRLGLKFAAMPRFGDRHLEYATRKFINDAATLVALLVVNDRQAEAEHVTHEVKKEQGDAAFHAKLAAALDKALEGTVPKPWP